MRHSFGLADADFVRIGRALGPHGRGASAALVWVAQSERLRRQRSAAAALTADRLRAAFHRWRNARRQRRRAGWKPDGDPADDDDDKKDEARGHQPKKRLLHHSLVRPLTCAELLCTGACARWRPDPAALGRAVSRSGSWVLAFGTYNVGGPRISLARFRCVLDALLQRRALAAVGATGDEVRRVWALTEFRTSTGDVRAYAAAAHAHGYALFASAESARERAEHGCGGGVAVLADHRLLVRDAVTTLEECVRGHLACVPLRAPSHAAQTFAFAAVYGPPTGAVSAVRAAVADRVADLQRRYGDRLVLAGDVNAATHAGDRRAAAAPPQDSSQSPRWAWLCAQEDAGALVDPVRAGAAPRPPPHTRVRLYSGTTAYLDRVYVGGALWAEMAASVTAAAVVGVGGAAGASDHDPVVVVWHPP